MNFNGKDAAKRWRGQPSCHGGDVYCLMIVPRVSELENSRTDVQYDDRTGRAVT
jgi:hypothetical protein